MVAFDNGYKAEFSYSLLARWDKDIHNDILSGRKSNDVGTYSRGGKVPIVKVQKKDHPGYLHNLYRETVHLKGSSLSFTELAEEMNALSARVLDPRPTLNLSKKIIQEWFISNSGKEISSLEKPLDTNKHKSSMIDWVVNIMGF